MILREERAKPRLLIPAIWVTTVWCGRVSWSCGGEQAVERPNSGVNFAPCRRTWNSIWYQAGADSNPGGPSRAANGRSANHTPIHSAQIEPREWAAQMELLARSK